jgi:Fic family protein
MLYATPKLDASDQRVLAEIEQYREDLRLHVRDAQQWDRQLRRNLTARAIRGSTTIEGFPASVDDVEDIMLGESPLEAPERTAIEIEGYQQAMTYVQRLAGAGPDFEYSKGLLNSLHFMMQRHHPRKRPGWWRNGPVYVTSFQNPRIAAYTAPEAEQLPDLTSELIDWLNQGDLDSPVLIRAAMAHFNLVGIHPWPDGNGRMSRALQTLVLARDGRLAPEFSSIEEWLGLMLNTVDYYKVLGLVQGGVWTPANNTHPWIRFCLRAHHEQAQLVAREVEITRHVWLQLEAVAERRGFPERMLFALYPATMGHRVRRATYQTDAEIGEQAAQRDLRRLIQEGWLEAHGDAQGRYYLAGSSVPDDMRDLVERPFPLVDPYATR